MIYENTPQSKTFSGIGYDFAESNLFLDFRSGGRYTYLNVPAYVWREFVAAPSKGTYYHQDFKTRGIKGLRSDGVAKSPVSDLLKDFKIVAMGSVRIVKFPDGDIAAVVHTNTGEVEVSDRVLAAVKEGFKQLAV